MHTLLTLLLLASPVAGGDLLVTSRNTDDVLRFDLATGAFLGVFAFGGGLDNPVGLTYGPDGNLYVASAKTDQVLRYDGVDGSFMDVFVQGPELDDPRQIQFGPTGDLYVASAGTDQVLRYVGATGAFSGALAANKLDGPNGITFGPGGDLYVAAVVTNRVKRYDGLTGKVMGNFVKSQINLPHDVSFGPDGMLYVTNAASTRITRFDGQTGTYLNDFVVDPALSAPLGMLWLDDGRLLVVNQGRNEVRVYDGVSGALSNVLVGPGTGGLSGPLYATAMPSPGPSIQLSPGTVSGTNHLIVRGAAPGAALTIALGRLGETETDLVPSPLLGTHIADERGQLVLRLDLSQETPGSALVLQAVDAVRQVSSPVTTIRLGD